MSSRLKLHHLVEEEGVFFPLLVRWWRRCGPRNHGTCPWDPLTRGQTTQPCWVGCQGLAWRPHYRSSGGSQGSTCWAPWRWSLPRCWPLRFQMAQGTTLEILLSGREQSSAEQWRVDQQGNWLGYQRSSSLRTGKEGGHLASKSHQVLC